ncbi:MAG TPA: DUF4105 domain-containing protein [Gemmatimonadaceae bacterium]|jgi:hypothetical protein|nr:DUF4105 domain-containing protein [Gemmatimonadaceae bacterium]
MPRTLLRALLLGASAVALTTPASARAAGGRQAALASQVDPLHQTGRNVRISLLTMGNGTQVWELFGHNAIWIHDLVTNRDTVFNWGVFDFRQPHFIQRFLKGTMLYSVGGDTMDNILLEYHYWNRSVVAQELDLTAEQRDTILATIQRNAQPENIQYRYDYFRDNCSTRVRDILDHAMGGALRKESAGLTGTTYRWHALRLMQVQPAIMLGVDLGLGRPSDVDLSKWQEMFLPRQLHDFVAGIVLEDGDGAKRPLVRRESVLFQATGRGIEPDAPPRFGIWTLIGGIVVAALFLWLGVAATNRRDWTRVAASVLIGVWSLAVGLLGTILVLLWAVTDHVFAHQNENLLIFNPLWLAFVVLVPMFLISGRAAGSTRLIAQALAALGLIALAAHFVGLSSQNNLAMIALGLPPTLALALITARRPVPAGRQPAASR